MIPRFNCTLLTPSPKLGISPRLLWSFTSSTSASTSVTVTGLMRREAPSGRTTDGMAFIRSIPSMTWAISSCFSKPTRKISNDWDMTEYFSLEALKPASTDLYFKICCYNVCRVSLPAAIRQVYLPYFSRFAALEVNEAVCCQISRGAMAYVDVLCARNSGNSRGCRCRRGTGVAFGVG